MTDDRHGTEFPPSAFAPMPFTTRVGTAIDGITGSLSVGGVGIPITKLEVASGSNGNTVMLGRDEVERLLVGLRQQLMQLDMAIERTRRVIATLERGESDMAGVDYYRCDKCGAKCFYDANLNWGCYSEERMLNREDLPALDDTGDIAALCNACAATFVIVIKKKDGES